MPSLSVASRIHPSAVISSSAQVAEGVTVGPYVTIEDGVVVGTGTELLAGTVLQGGARIGANCLLGPYAVVGGKPMDTHFRGEESYAILGDGVVMRDFTTVHRASGEGAETHVGAGTLIMSYAHVSHNVWVGKECVLTTNVQLGGRCQIGDYAVLGSTAILHQFCRIGTCAMYGAGSASNQDVLPFSMARGNPAQHFRLNKVGLERRGITGERYRALEHAIRAFRRRDWERLAELAQVSDEVKLMLEFRESSQRGICSFVR